VSHNVSLATQMAWGSRYAWVALPQFHRGHAAFWPYALLQTAMTQLVAMVCLMAS
jgi:hypothetical protein